MTELRPTERDLAIYERLLPVVAARVAQVSAERGLDPEQAFKVVMRELEAGWRTSREAPTQSPPSP